MVKAPSKAIKQVGDFPVNITSFTRHCWAENLSPATVDAYVGATQQFYRFLVDQGMPLDVANVRREHVETFVTDLLDHW